MAAFAASLSALLCALLCLIIGHRRHLVRDRLAVEGEARVACRCYGWRCHRCGWAHLRWDFVGLDAIHDLRLRAALDRLAAEYPEVEVRTLPRVGR
jgi:hypothetical protein